MTIIDFDLKAVLDGTDDLALTGITDMTVSGNLLYTVSASGTLTAFRLTSAGLVEVDQASLPSSGIAGVDAELQSVTTDEGAVAVLVTGAGSGGLWSISSTPKGSLSGAAATAGGLPPTCPHSRPLSATAPPTLSAPVSEANRPACG